MMMIIIVIIIISTTYASTIHPNKGHRVFETCSCLLVSSDIFET